ncbi:MAG: caspase family protein [Bacteroidota bacterium]
MKMKRIVLLLVVLSVSVTTWSQNHTATTNELHLDLKTGLRNSTSVPVISWVTPKLEHTVSSENSIVVEAIVKSVNPMTEINLVIVDGLTRTTQGVKKIKVTDPKEIRIQETVFLPTGNVLLELQAVNADGFKVSSTRTVRMGDDLMANAVMIDRKDYALVFATDKYDHWDDLVNPVNDAHSIATELKDKYGFDTEVVENPTIEEVWEKIRSYSERKFKPQDQLLIFFAGHGQFDETFGEGYVVAKNSLLNDKSRNTYISHNRLRGVINNIQCQHIFLMMDVCFGGTFDPVLARSRGDATLEASDEEIIVRKLSQKTRKYLTSGGKEYVSDGTPGSHSPFATKFLASLKTDGGEDRILTLTELQIHLEKLKQLPRFGSFGDDSPLSDFIFIRR